VKAIKSVYRRQDGFTLIYVACFLFLAIGLVVSILDLSTNHRKIAQQQTNLEKAMYVAEAGLELGASYLGSNITTIAAVTYTNGSIGGGSYSCLISQLDYRTYRIISTGIVNNVSRVVSLQRIYQPTYAEFSIWSATNGAIWFTVGEVFTGHVHADDAMYFMNPGGTTGPVFHGYCDTKTNYYYTETGSSAVKNGSTNGITFDKGFQLNTYEGTMADVDFNSTNSTSLLNMANNNDGLVLQGFSTITFNGGTLSILNSRQGWTNSHTYTPASEGLIYVQNATSGTTTNRGGQVYLKGGYLTGRLTIVTESNIFIEGSLLYTSDPRTNSASTDALGLISHDNIIVNTNAQNNLEIDAEMMAVGNSKASGGDGSAGSFTVLNYDSGSARGTLTLYGGIVQNIRGAVGTLDSSGNIKTGYKKNYSYDSRFIDDPPPFYPAVKKVLQWSNWQEGPN